LEPVRPSCLETIQHELCAKDLVYLRAKRDDEDKEVKKNPTMKLSAIFVATMDRVAGADTRSLFSST
jgi:obg-like ATPase 1